MNQLSQRLLNNLDQYYDEIASSFLEEGNLGSIRDKLQLSFEDIMALHEVMFDPNPIYTVNRNGKKVRMRFCASTLQSKEIEDNGKC